MSSNLLIDLIPSIVIFSTNITISYCIEPLIRRYIDFNDEKKKSILVTISLLNSVAWGVCIYSILSPAVNTTNSIFNRILLTLDELQSNVNIITSCFNESDTEVLSLEEITPIRDDVLRYDDIVIYGMLSIYGFFILYTSGVINLRSFDLVINIVIFLMTIVLIPLSSIFYGIVVAVCSNSLSVYASSSLSQYGIELEDELVDELVKVEECSPNDILFDTLLDPDDIRNKNYPGCDSDSMANLSTHILTNIVGCNRIGPIYDSVVDKLICDDMYRLSVLTFWAISVGTITITLYMNISRIQTNIYSKI